MSAGWLSGFIKTITEYCYAQNIKALGLMVSEKRAFVCFSHCKYRTFGSCGFREDFFHGFPILSLWQVMTPRGVTCMEPRGTVGRICKEDRYTLLHTKYESSEPCVFGEEVVFSIVSIWELSVSTGTTSLIQSASKPNAVTVNLPTQ